jgi:hypothetical protein
LFFSLLDAVNLLSLTSGTVSNARTSPSEIAEGINQVVDKNDFTIMFTIRSQVTASGVHMPSFKLAHNTTHKIAILSLS